MHARETAADASGTMAFTVAGTTSTNVMLSISTHCVWTLPCIHAPNPEAPTIETDAACTMLTTSLATNDACELASCHGNAGMRRDDLRAPPLALANLRA